jgi:rod shape-determining protein MreC
VILLTDLNSRVPVAIAPGNVQAMMTGDNSATPRLELVSRTVTSACRRPGDQFRRWRLAAGRPAVGTVVSGWPADGAWRCLPMPPPARMSKSEFLQAARSTAPSAQLPAEARGLKPQAPPPPRRLATIVPASSSPTAANAWPSPASPSPSRLPGTRAADAEDEDR